MIGKSNEFLTRFQKQVSLHHQYINLSIGWRLDERQSLAVTCRL